MTLTNRQTVNIHQRMAKQDKEMEESKQQLLTGYGALNPGDTIVVTVERSRTSITKCLRLYSIALPHKRMANLTYHCAKVMMHNLNKEGKIRTTDTADEFVHYLSVALFGANGKVDQDKKLDCQVLD